MKKFIALLLCLMCVLPAAACSDGKENDDGLTLVYDFESTIRPVGMNSTFGKINLNSDKNFVANGNRSLKVNPIGTSSIKPYMLLPFIGETLGGDYSDATMLDEVHLKINAPKDMDMYMGLYFSTQGELRSPSKTITLREGWNDITYTPEYSLLAISYDLKDSIGIFLQFDQYKEEETPDVYIDDVKVKLREEPATYENLITLKKTADYIEICDFEKVYQSVVFTPRLLNNAVPMPVVEVVNAADYGLTAPSGKKVLRLEIYPKTTSDTSWTQMYLSKAVLDAVGIKALADETDNYAFMCDLYQKEGNALLLEVNAYSGKKAMDWAGVTSKKGEWVTMNKPLGQLNAKGFVSDPSEFAFAWLDLKSGAPVGEYFIDNIRIEKIK